MSQYFYTDDLAGISHHIDASVGFHILAEQFALKVKFWCEKVGSPQWSADCYKE